MVFVALEVCTNFKLNIRKMKSYLLVSITPWRLTTSEIRAPLTLRVLYEVKYITLCGEEVDPSVRPFVNYYRWLNPMKLLKKFLVLNVFQKSSSVRFVGRDRAVSIATRYGLDGQGIESWCGPDFLHPSGPALGAHPASYTMGGGSCGRDVALTTHLCRD